MIFRFQRQVAPGHWIDVGSAYGSGVNPAAQALDQLIGEAGGPLAAGDYRYRPVDGQTHVWSSLTISTPSSSVSY